MAKPKLVGALISAFSLLILGTIGVVLLRNSNRPPLPPLDDITGIRIRSFYDKAQHKEVDFDVPKEYWNEILTALSPYEKDQDPARWEILACMDVATKSGKKNGLLLFYLENEPTGAFEFWDVYYRGGNSGRLMQTIVKACEKSKIEQK